MVKQHEASNTFLERLKYLDGWRGLSILAVMIGHFFPIHFLNIGRLGVEMFFVLSGRLMAEILFTKNINLPKFFKRRITRVWPALFFFVIAITVTVFFFRTSDTPSVSSIFFFSCISFTYNYIQIYYGHYEFLDHIWSLCVEEHTYILLAGIAYLYRRFGVSPEKLLIAIALIFILNGAIQTYLLNLGYYEVYWRTDTRAASIIIAVIAYLRFNKPCTDTVLTIYPPITFFVAGLLFNLNLVPDPIKYSVGTMFLAICVCRLNELSRPLMSILTSKYLTWFGLISFSLYLWQQPFFKLVGYIPRLYLIVAALLIALFSFYFVETPARKKLNDIW